MTERGQWLLKVGIGVIVVLFAVFALFLWAVDQAEASVPQPDSVAGVWFMDSYPADGAISIPHDTSLWWSIPRNPDLAIDSLTVWLGNYVVVDSGVADTGDYTVSVSGDTLYLSVDDGDWGAFYEYQWKVEVLWGDTSYADSLMFRTASDTIPFYLFPVYNVSTGSGATGTDTISIVKPFGATVYYAKEGATAAVAVSPEAAYADERLNRICDFSLSGISPGYSRYYFWAETPESLTTCSLSCYFKYSISDGGVQRGVIGR